MSDEGNLRNLAYGLQWWLFGGFVVFMWWRMARDDLRGATPRAGTSAVPAVRPAAVPPAPPAAAPAASSAASLPALVGSAPAPADVGEPPDDPELEAYNRYLARLSAGTERRRP